MKGSDIWHNCLNCSNYPKTMSKSGERCNECKSKVSARN